MILSFHPCFEADKNIICAGRMPAENDLTAIKEADAVILSQGCSESLYNMARKNCPHVFPNFDARFQYPGKINQILLFQQTNTPHPETEIFQTVRHFKKRYGHVEAFNMPLPVVFKFNWGGEGDTVYPIFSMEEFQQLLNKAETFEKTGQSGFMLQKMISTKGNSLRINVVGGSVFSFWRILYNPVSFHANVSKGADIDYDAYPELQEIAQKSVFDFCTKTGINLAGIDILFNFRDSGTPDPHLFFLEINYFFGRRGLGGSENFYKILVREIDAWLKDRGLETRNN